MPLTAIMFAERSADCRFAVVRRGNGWTLMWRSRSGGSGSRSISSNVATALDNTTTGGLLVAEYEERLSSDSDNSAAERLPVIPSDTNEQSIQSGRRGYASGPSAASGSNAVPIDRDNDEERRARVERLVAEHRQCGRRKAKGQSRKARQIAGRTARRTADSQRAPQRRTSSTHPSRETARSAQCSPPCASMIRRT